ncbi:MAG: hypothetical protein V4555_10920 [Acidobacteriota bacterium]
MTTKSRLTTTLALALSPLLLAALAPPQDKQANPALPQTAPDPRPQSAIPLPAYHAKIKQEFQTSDRCVACHNGLKTSTGEDVSIGIDWQASAMANSARDPYWQASIRREAIDHPQATAEIEDDCSTCHMPVLHFTNRDAGRKTEVFKHFPLQTPPKGSRAAADGVSCAVCHQAEPDNLGTPDSLNGNLKFAKLLSTMPRPEYGPFVVDTGHQSIMEASTGGFLPKQGDQLRDPSLCGTCHTLTTKALAPDGTVIAHFPEQRPFQEWQHSQYSAKDTAAYQTCQQCHMPEVKEAAPVTALYGPLREGMHRHVFVGGNFVLTGMLQDHRDDLATVAQPDELRAEVDRTRKFLETQAARVEILHPASTANGIRFDVHAENLTGHKLPTAYPSRRVWLHVTVRDANNRIVFESGHLNADGSITGNANDTDPLRYEPHFTEITNPDQVEIYEPILGDQHGKVTPACSTPSPTSRTTASSPPALTNPPPPKKSASTATPPKTPPSTTTAAPSATTSPHPTPTALCTSPSSSSTSPSATAGPTT